MKKHFLDNLHQQAKQGLDVYARMGFRGDISKKVIDSLYSEARWKIRVVEQEVDETIFNISYLTDFTVWYYEV